MNNLTRPEKDPEYKKIGPEPIYVFRKLAPSDRIFLPELAENRKCTNIGCLIFFGICMIILIIFTIYILVTTSMATLVNGRDECGNICGMDNADVKIKDKDDCTAKDYADLPVPLYEKKGKKWVATTCIKEDDCDEINKRELIFNHCFPEDEGAADKTIFRVLEIAPQIGYCLLAMVICSILLSLLLYLSFRLCVKATFYILLIIAFVLFVLLTIYYWFVFAITLNFMMLLPAIMYTVALIFIIYLCWVIRKRFKLVVELFREATGYIFRAPLLLVLPLLTTAFILGVTVAEVFLIIQALSDRVDQSGSTGTICFVIFLFFMATWLITFSTGCQTMVIAGTAAACYFSTDKSMSHAPCFASLCIMMSYHLGTIAFGSLIITIVKMLRTICEIARHNSDNIACYIFLCCLECILACLEEILEYLCKKAYIMTSIHGRALITSGMRAMRLLWHFLLDTIAVDMLGHMVMQAAGFLIILASIGIGYFILKPAVYEQFPDDESSTATIITILLVVVLACISSIVVFYFMTVMNVVVETIFLCFCEDKLMNDGSQARPFFMTRRLLEVMLAAWELSAKEREEEERRELERERQHEDRNRQQYENQDQYRRQTQDQDQYRRPNQYESDRRNPYADQLQRQNEGQSRRY